MTQGLPSVALYDIVTKEASQSGMAVSLSACLPPAAGGLGLDRDQSGSAEAARCASTRPRSCAPVGAIQLASWRDHSSGENPGILL